MRSRVLDINLALFFVALFCTHTMMQGMAFFTSGDGGGGCTVALSLKSCHSCCYFKWMSFIALVRRKYFSTFRPHFIGSEGYLLGWLDGSLAAANMQDLMRMWARMVLGQSFARVFFTFKKVSATHLYGEKGEKEERELFKL